MKSKRQKNRIASILMLVVALIILSLFAVYVATNSGAKYIITDTFSVNLSNYYIEVIEPVTTEFENTLIETSFTVNNNDGTNYMTEALVYTISVKENTKWDILVANGIERTINGGSIGSDTPLVTITPNGSETINPVETITIILTITSPYPDIKEIELTYINIPSPTLSISTSSWVYPASQLRTTGGSIVRLRNNYKPYLCTIWSLCII